MGFLNKESEIVIDAVITKKGRRYLADAIMGEHIIIDTDGNQKAIPGTDKHKITKFALSDDEVDYGLWDITPDSNDVVYYGAVIDNLPLTEAVFNSNEIMNYLLFKHGVDARILESSLPIPILNTVNVTLSTNESEYIINMDWDEIDGFSGVDGDVYNLYINNDFKQSFSTSFASTSNGSLWGVPGGTNYNFRVSYYDISKDQESTRSNQISLLLPVPGAPPPPPGGGGPPPGEM
tara:strand:+ start:218 stop:922 length:705 start_codon:yes stop_codon:yes gene_type:complete